MPCPLVYPDQRLSCIARLTHPNLGRGPSEIARPLSERAEPSRAPTPGI